MRLSPCRPKARPCPKEDGSNGRVSAYRRWNHASGVGHRRVTIALHLFVSRTPNRTQARRRCTFVRDESLHGTERNTRCRLLVHRMDHDSVALEGQDPGGLSAWPTTSVITG
jgi:hypothetical protein